MKIMVKLLIRIMVVLLTAHESMAGILGLLGGYGLCQTACNAAWVACLASAGVVAGTVTAGAGAPAAVLACNALQGVCMGSCAVTFLVAPTP
ncbi:unnamed protein product [Medioppia subpectinata]|uniref:Uncharacterized protein n=1 Tax=Medioppia subpectinata TaxID=1979941 RepID=A0A7R9KKA0_9ACAR|nr:unnamed protein product [Medioppia subpectinata]CAG2105276.1 unnamed protein product [Medioppia subpectinata]